MHLDDRVHWETNPEEAPPMSTTLKKGQAVTFTNPRGQVRAGKYLGEVNLGPGRGQGVYAEVDVDGKTLRARPSKVRAA